MNPLNIDSIYLSINEISQSLPSVSTALPDSNELTRQLEHLSLHSNGAAAATTAAAMNNVAGIASNEDGGSGKVYLQDDGSFNVISNNVNEFYYSTTSVKEMSNCSASCSHSNGVGISGGGHDVPRSSKRFRPHHLSRRLDTTIPRKSLDSVRKKPLPTSKHQQQFRQRATSFGALQLSQGKFGAVCRKMFLGQQRRRKSFSISSKSSSIDADINDLTITPAAASDSQLNNVNQRDQRGCGHEAATSPPTGDLPDCYPVNIENGEIDELAEYFEHFVSVHRKMSALAESMYV